MAERFVDRADAGAALARELLLYRGRADTLVLALPRGGVPVAAVVARELRLPLDVLVVRKVGLPSQPEVAMGAIAGVAGGVTVVQNPDVLAHLGRSGPAEFDRVANLERIELQRRVSQYRSGRPPLDLEGKTVLLVDDGLATGATMRAAVTALKPSGVARIVVAVPIGSAKTCRELAELVDELVCVWMPDPFWAVGQGYLDFTQTSDAEVQSLLESVA